MNVLIAAPIGGHKQYSINAWFQWIADQDWKDYDIAISANGDVAAELCQKLREVRIKDKHGQDKKVISLELPNSKDLTIIQRITYSREQLRRYAVEHDYDYLFFLDTDTIPACKDTIEHMLLHDVDVLSGLYFYKGTRVPVVISKDTNTNMSLETIEFLAKKDILRDVHGFGFGCLLLSRKAFEKCSFDYHIFGEERSDDFGYCHVLSQAGFLLYFDARMICKHLEPPKSDVQNVPVMNIQVVKLNKGEGL